MPNAIRCQWCLISNHRTGGTGININLVTLGFGMKTNCIVVLEGLAQEILAQLDTFRPGTLSIHIVLTHSKTGLDNIVPVRREPGVLEHSCF